MPGIWVIPGVWRTGLNLQDTRVVTGSNISSKEGKKQRNLIKHWANSEAGSVPWQDRQDMARQDDLDSPTPSRSGSLDSHASLASQASTVAKSKKKDNKLSDEEEELMVAFLEANEMLWNKKATHYRRPDFLYPKKAILGRDESATQEMRVTRRKGAWQ